MDIQAVNVTLSKAILFLQEAEIEGLLEFTVPSPKQMHQKHGMPLPAGMAKDELIGKGKARKGMKLGDGWVVVKASPTRVTIQLPGAGSRGYKVGKPLTYIWDGIGYARQGDYVHADGVHKLAGSKPVDPSKLYPEGSVIQSMEKWVWIIAGKGKPHTGWRGDSDGYEYPVRKLKGKKTVKMIINARGDVDVDDGKRRISLYRATVRPPS